jgi:hypothetical protein
MFAVKPPPKASNAVLRFLWLSSRGYRLAPWRSPYLRWRIETYSGLPAESIDAAAFFRFLWTERQSLLEYLRWLDKSGN